jgi:UDP-N-acetylmuramyl pentapeptide phosphotransferase/UDP-N-acetylglucosamine-1-phosphate transferase
MSKVSTLHNKALKQGKILAGRSGQSASIFRLACPYTPRNHMKIFFERFENDEQVTILHKPYYIYFFFFALMLSFASNAVPILAGVKTFTGIVWFAAMLLVFYRVFAMRSVNREIKEALSKGTATVTGSKLNASDPMTVKISKNVVAGSGI